VDESKRWLAHSEIAHLELYHRTSRSVRAVLEREGPATGSASSLSSEVEFRRGHEEGIAVRLWRTGERQSRFVATTGTSAGGIGRAVERALAADPTVCESSAERCEPATVAGDHDDGALPDAGRLATWLLEAREILTSVPSAAVDVERSWVEAARTEETWIVDGRPIASRTRARGWAGVQPVDAVAPSILASRSWSHLDPGDLLPLLECRRTVEGGPGIGPAGRAPLLVSADASATLVLALVRTLPMDRVAGVVGPGFRVWDAPEEDGALFGGRFDDLGYPTSRRQLANGADWIGGLSGRGHYRRPSFRDAPLCLPSNLVVEPAAVGVLDEGWFASRVVIHPLTPEGWILDLDATPWRRGRPCGETRRAQVATGPRELVARCSGGVGPSFASHRGVRTPALRFEGLALRA